MTSYGRKFKGWRGAIGFAKSVKMIKNWISSLTSWYPLLLQHMAADYFSAIFKVFTSLIKLFYHSGGPYGGLRGLGYWQNQPKLSKIVWVDIFGRFWPRNSYATPLPPPYRYPKNSKIAKIHFLGPKLLSVVLVLGIQESPAAHVGCDIFTPQ